MFVEKLRQFGLDEKEISVYLALISLGPASVRAISAKSGVNRGTTYDILKSLNKQGLVSYYHKYQQDSKKQHFVAEPPDKIVTAIEKRIGDLSALKTSVAKSLPELESLYEKSGAKPVVKYYEGISGVRVILQDVIGTMGGPLTPNPSPSRGEGGRRPGEGEKRYCVYSSADIRDYLYKAYPNFNKDRIKAGISNQVISFGKGGELVGLDERKWLDTEHGSPTYILVYGGKVAMISVAANGEPVGVVVEDKALYQTQKMIFEQIWRTLPK